MEKVITIPKKLVRDDLVVIQKESFERLNRENLELKEAIRAILAGETAFKKGRTRTFRQFLKSRLPIYVKSR